MRRFVADVSYPIQISELITMQNKLLTLSYAFDYFSSRSVGLRDSKLNHSQKTNRSEVSVWTALLNGYTDW
jgi:hypothetical protein